MRSLNTALLHFSYQFLCYLLNRTKITKLTAETDLFEIEFLSSSIRENRCAGYSFRGGIEGRRCCQSDSSFVLCLVRYRSEFQS